ncbi:MAG: HD domain-containing protein [Clostridia bacterium]|nr:HD domain-containing protein [Clostridia bacterium]
MKISIPENILKAITLLTDGGYEAYIVGGCVRDAYLNKIPNDWDITTSATPEQMKNIFSDFRVIETGIKHGTLSVIIDGDVIEITTMRVDGDYTDNRHPDSVEFTCEIHKDLSRRDFTVNAMAYNPETGLVDPFDGRGDIERKIIRCVGDPDRRFSEDALRIMRALRFACTLDFNIAPETAESIIKNKALLNNVAKERIRVELLKLLCGVRVKEILLDFALVFFEIIPELEPMYNFPQNTPYHIFDVWEHTALAVQNVPADPVLRMAMLLHDIGKPAMHTVDENGISHFKRHQSVSFEKSCEILKRLRFSKSEQEEITRIILYHDLHPKGEREEIIRLCVELSTDFMLRLIPVFKADAMAQNPEFLHSTFDEINRTEQMIHKLTEEKVCLSMEDLTVNGNDLSDLGFKGRNIGSTLKLILDKVSQGEISNVREEILTYIKENILLN